jgi:hypothetical protein
VQTFRPRLKGWLLRAFATCVGVWLCVTEDTIAMRAFGAIVAVVAVAGFVTAVRRRLIVDDTRLTLEGALIRVSIRWRDVVRYRHERYEETRFAIPGVAYWSRDCARVVVEANDGRSIVVGDMYRDGGRALELVLVHVRDELGDGQERVPAARVV